MKEEMDAGNFWNISKNNTNDTKDFFATRDATKTPFSDISFANNANVKPDIIPVDTTTSVEIKENSERYTEELKDEEYCLELISLNKCVLEWIKKHVNKNPCIDLTPVIKDYEKHLNSIGEQYEVRIQANQIKLHTTPEPTHPSPVSSTSGNKDTVSFVSSTPINNNGVSAVVKFPPAGFFTPSCPIKPVVIEKPELTNQKVVSGKNDAAPEDAPPVVERKTIVEDDAFYQIRSKLFFKKDTQWQELGIGMLYLKQCGDKIQLLIRMEAVTGKVLLNINVSNELPISRSGKNNVMVVSVPNPPVYAKPADGDNSLPCTYLIRVKGTTEADELFLKLKPKT